MIQIIDDEQYKALSFISFANRGGSRPKEGELREWMLNPQPKPRKQGPLIRPEQPAKYRMVNGLVYDADSLRKVAQVAQNVLNSQTFRGLSKLADDWNRASENVFSPGIQKILGTRELVEAAVPAEYGPDIPAETFVQHLVRLGWIDRDDSEGLGLTALGRALLRSEDLAESEYDGNDVVVLNAQNELSYPMLIQRLVEIGEALLVDPYLRVEQLLAVRAYTSISRVLISEQLRKEDRAAMAVLVENSSSKPLELRMAKRGVLHDRMAIGRTSAFTIGTSMNTVGKQHPTILTPLPELAADAMRAHVEKWWNEATLVATAPSEVDRQVD